ncbi:MFS transporter [Streptomyces sp. NPDC006655]|uniref:MFS transporter n=1 Tax=Streptomyces sp. NPDC006655 TaxID=3156898 RepID=UPI0034542B31
MSTTTPVRPRRSTVAKALNSLGDALIPGSKQGRIVAVGAAADSVANGLYLAAATLYFVHFLHVSAVAIGSAIAIANVVGLITPMIFGPLADRLGSRTVYVGLTLLRAVGFVAYGFVTNYVSYLVVTCVVTGATRACSPLLQVIVGEFEAGTERTRTMASLRAIGNIGLTIGFFLAAVVQAAQSRIAFIAFFSFNAVVFVGVAFSVVTAGRVVGTAAAAPAENGPHNAKPPAAPTRSPYRDLRFLIVTCANGVLMLHDCVLFILLPLWIVQRAGLPASVSSGLLAVNTVLTVVLQMAFGRLAKGTDKALRVLRFACVFLVLACACFAGADGRSPLVALGSAIVAIALLTTGENLHAIARWELSYEMSPPRARAQYLSLFSTGMSVQLVVGPFLMTAVLLPSGAAGWLALAGLFAMATLVTLVAARPAPAVDADGMSLE